MAEGDINYLANNNNDCEIEIDGVKQRAILNASYPAGGTSNVLIQDATNPLIIAKFNNVQAGTTLATATAIDDIQIEVSDGTGITVGTYIVMYSTVIDRFYVGTVVVDGGTILTMDTPLDSAFPVGSIVGAGITNMNVNGVITPQVFGLRGPAVAEPLNQTFDITRIIMHCLTSSAVDLSTFGDIAGGLVNGLVLRQRNGEYYNIFNVKTNGEIDGITLDWNPYSSTNPQQGQDGFTARLTFNGPDKMGAVVRLPEGTDLEFIVQDDLTSLDLFEVVAEGHIVEY